MTCKWQMMAKMTNCAPTWLEYSLMNPDCVPLPSHVIYEQWRRLVNLPPDRLILLLTHRLGPLTKWRAIAKGVDEAVAMAAQSVALSGDVWCILDDQLVIGSQPHVLGPLQETLHAALLFLLERQPVVNPLPGQPATHHWDKETRRWKHKLETSEREHFKEHVDCCLVFWHNYLSDKWWSFYEADSTGRWAGQPASTLEKLYCCPSTHAKKQVSWSHTHTTQEVLTNTTLASSSASGSSQKTLWGCFLLEILEECAGVGRAVM